MKKYANVQDVPKTWLSASEAKKFLGCSDKYLQKLRDNAKVSFARDGKMIFYNLHSIELFLNKIKVI
ncbi:MAG: helix-turn-helix domain-containing protein [Bacteroidaceae bacterium]